MPKDDLVQLELLNLCWNDYFRNADITAIISFLSLSVQPIKENCPCLVMLAIL